MNSYRALLVKTGEYIYPDKPTYAALSEFFGIVEGYHRKGMEVEVHRGSGIFDAGGFEIFEKDVILLSGLQKEGEIELENEEEGYVSIEEGCFIVQNEQGLDLDLGTCASLPNLIKIKVASARIADRTDDSGGNSGES